MKILNFGSCNIDYVYKLDHIVTPGETETSELMEMSPEERDLTNPLPLPMPPQDCSGKRKCRLTMLLNMSDTQTVAFSGRLLRNGME